MNFNNFSDSELVTKLKYLATEERKITTEILHFLGEVESRRLFAFWGYPSLFEFCTKELGYSAGTAQRRIESMRLLKSLGEDGSKQIEAGLQEGKINLTHLSLLQTFVRNKEKKENQKINPEEKISLINQMATRSTRECEKILQAMSPETPLFPKEKERVIAENRIELKFSVSDSLLKKLERIRELRSHIHPKMTYEELLEYLAEVALGKMDPERRAKRTQNKKLQRGTQESPTSKVKSLPAPEIQTEKMKKPVDREEQRPLELLQGNSDTAATPLLQSHSSLCRSIPTHIKRKVYLRDNGCCTFRSAVTGKVCGSRFGIEFEHIQPLALGGPHTEENVTLHCSAHNIARAFQVFGEKKMRLYVK